MKLFPCILSILLLPMVGMAVTIHLDNEDTYPVTITHSMQDAATNYIIFDEDVTTDNSILSFSTSGGDCHGWDIDLGGNRLIFGNNGGSNERGILISSNTSTNILSYSHDFYVHDGTIQAAAPPDDCDSNYMRDAQCIRLSGYNVLIEDVNLITDGYCGKGIQLEGGKGFFRVNRGYDTCKSDCYGSRTDFGSSVMKIKADWDSTIGEDYNAYFYGVNITNACQVAIECRSATATGAAIGIKIKIEACTLMVDARNVHPSFGDLNCYAMELTRLADSSIIRENVTTPGTAYEGYHGGIHVNGRRYHGYGYVHVDKNKITSWEGVHPQPQGCDDETNTLCASQGLNFEYSCRFSAESNLVVAYYDTDEETTYKSRKGYGFYYSWNGPDTAYNIIRYNNVRTICESGSGCTNATLHLADIDYVTENDRHSIFQFNRWQSNNWVAAGMMGGGSVTGGGVNWDRDTFVIDANPISGHGTFKMGYNGSPICPGWVAKDCAFLGEAADNDIVTLAYGQWDLTDKYTMNIHVQDSSTTPIEGAIVWGINSYSERTNFTNTDANGNTSQVFTTGYYQIGGPNLTGYNPITFYASYGDTVSVAHSVVWNAKADTLTMPSGTPPVPPAGTALIKFKK